MAPAKDLAIYTSAMRLATTLHQTTRKAPRDLRHTLVQELLSKSVRIPTQIALANLVMGTERIPRVEKLIGHIAETDVLLNIAMELHCLSKGATAVAMEHIDSLGRQSYGWLQKTSQTSATTTR